MSKSSGNALSVPVNISHTNNTDIMHTNQPFETALAALKQGHDISRANWNYTLRYLDGKCAKIKGGKVINPNWIFSPQDSFAEDWNVPEIETSYAGVLWRRRR